MKSETFLIIYSFIVCLFLMVVGIVSARSDNQLLASFIYLPLVFFFGTKIYFLLERKAILKSPTKKSQALTVFAEPETVKGIADKDKRLFLQLIGTTSFSLLLMALFSNKARNTFLGGTPTTPENVTIKDIAGKSIDPAERHPTDGYNITDIDDASTPAYYSFVNNNGAWYIMQKNAGTFRYAKGDANYSASWDVRDKLRYDYYNRVFSS